MLTYTVRYTHNSRRTMQLQPDAGCRLFPAHPTRSAVHIADSQNGTQNAGTRLQAAQFLIANPRLTFEVSCNDPSDFQISNREQIAVFSPLRRPALIEAGDWVESFTNHQSRVTNHGFLIVTLGLELPATRRKQTSNQNPNRYKMRFLDSPWRTRFLHLDSLGRIRILQLASSRINRSRGTFLRRLHRGSPAPNMAPLVNLPSIGVIHAL